MKNYVISNCVRDLKFWTVPMYQDASTIIMTIPNWSVDERILTSPIHYTWWWGSNNDNNRCVYSGFKFLFCFNCLPTKPILLKFDTIEFKIYNSI